MTDAQISHTLSDEQRTASVELRSLAPSYNAEYHDTYVQHLDAVVNDPRNKNVALTGRYGTGKSSVLDRFEELHGSKVLRISITTLGPDRDGEGLTNRIQKELVKQLIYRTKPSELRSSRFARTDSITARKACLQGASAVAVLGLFLALGGWLPPVATFPDDLTKSLSSVGQVLLFVLEWGLFYAAAAAIASWVRMALESRIVTSLSTAGASITLGERDDTYFDTYLDELVTYFDRAGEDYVILEDLDRFDDPAIFDSLRELNSIVNSSPRRNEAAQGRQLCFIYAIKDSLFERLSQPETRQDPGAEQRTGGESLEAGDAADSWQHSENRQNPASSVRTQNEPSVERANRTKFFDVVIPMVPFLSHRNARDVLDNELAQRNIPAGTVSRALLSLVARHATDMRLLSNILNEFIVYAQRLLWVDDAAPGLTGDQLFALVAYKNSHLADFEAVPVRKSALDQLDSAHRRLVRHAVASRQEHRRRARESVLTESRQGALAERLSRELVGAARATLFQNQPAFRQLAGYQIGDKTFDPADAGTIGFWKTVAENQTIALVPLNGNETYVAGAREMTWEALQSLFPDAFKEGVWSAELGTAVQRRVETLTAELDFLPGADYADLLERPEFEDEHGRTFANILELHLPSDIARELVRNRHINRNFATYSAIFYGTFAGIDAETFYYRAVQPNEMMLDHRFDSDDSLRNLLEQLDNDEPDFYQTVSALNPQIVTHLLKHQPDRARQVAGFITTHFDDNAREFMSAYFAEDGVPHASLVDLLAAHPWRGLFDHLASDAVPDNLRLGLIDAALTHATGVADFALGKDIRRYVAENHTQMHAFTEEGQRTKQAEIVRDFACECDVQVEDLAKVAQPLRQLLVGARMYLLTADNLRAALGVQGSVSLDVVANDEAVNTRCLADIDTYLQVSAADPA
ncbi:hypothetical protein HQO90_23200, partial [Rhodococcus fascians]|nr:hypothetical protein [Rhodococcus fascians]